MLSYGLVGRLIHKACGNQYLIDCLMKVRQSVEKTGELTEACLADFKTGLRDDPGTLMDKLEAFRAGLTANPEQLEPAVLRERHRVEVVQYLDQQIRDFRHMKDWAKEREDKEEEARRAAAVLPTEAVLEKVLRYETALDRKLYRSMNQLERLQRRRLGEQVPPPLTVELSAKD